MIASAESGYLLVALGAAALERAGTHRARVPGTLAMLAALAAGLALAGFAAAGYPAWGMEPAPHLAAPGGPSPAVGFLAVAGALLGTGGLLAGVGGIAAWRQGGRLARTSALPIVLGAASLARGAAAAIALVPMADVALAGVGLAAVGAGLVGMGRFVRVAGAAAAPAPSGRMLLVLLVATLATAVGDYFAIIVSGVIAGIWSAWLMQRGRGASKVPVAPALALLLLPAWWLMATIAGAEGLAVAALPMLPLSPAAERLLVPLLLLAGWTTTGLWPLHRQVPGALVAPIGAILVLRVVVPAMPDGLDHWRALLMPAIVLGIWHAALGGRVAGVIVGLAWVGVLGASRDGARGAALLLAGAVMLAIEPYAAAHAGVRVRRWWPPLRIVVALAGSVGAVLSVRSGLGAEVVYTVLALAGLAILAGHAPRQAADPAEPAAAPQAATRVEADPASGEHGERAEKDRS